MIARSVTEFVMQDFEYKVPKKMKLEPLDNRIIVKPAEAKDRSQGGILLPDRAKEQPMKGEVLAVGPGKMVDGCRMQMDIVAGDVVMYGSFAGCEVEVDGEKYLILREDDVLAKVIR